MLVENDVRGGPPWYHDGFELTQETPYTFHSLDELLPPRSCRQNRGSVNSPLFLLNHWIERVNPSPGLAAEVNERRRILRRARRCGADRGLQPNIVAVDFYDEGALLEAVDALNRVSPR